MGRWVRLKKKWFNLDYLISSEEYDEADQTPHLVPGGRRLDVFPGRTVFIPPCLDCEILTRVLDDEVRETLSRVDRPADPEHQFGVAYDPETGEPLPGDAVDRGVPGGDEPGGDDEAGPPRGQTA